MENIVNDTGRILSQTIRAFKEIPAMLKIGEYVKKEVEDFRKYVPLALALRTEGMKERHWDEISTIAGFDVRPKEGFTMTTVIKMNLIDHLSEIEKVGEKAAKEYAIEMNLLNMKKSWEKVEFKLFSWKNSGTWIVSQLSFEEINMLIDENMVLTQQMMSSCNFNV
jgi:dynein heavy chain